MTQVISNIINQAPDEYEAVAASQTDQALGATGAIGDILTSIVISVGTSLTGTCSIKDGSGAAIPLTPASTPIGVYAIYLNVKSVSAGGWKVTTGAGATALALGRFT